MNNSKDTSIKLMLFFLSSLFSDDCALAENPIDKIMITSNSYFVLNLILELANDQSMVVPRFIFLN